MTRPTESEIVLDPETCAHEAFGVYTDINRIGDGDNGRPEVIVGYYACIKVECAECKTPFHFKGLEYGLTPDCPRVEIGGLECRMPIGPGRLPMGDFGTARYALMNPMKGEEQKAIQDLLNALRWRVETHNSDGEDLEGDELEAYRALEALVPARTPALCINCKTRKVAGGDRCADCEWQYGFENQGNL